MSGKIALLLSIFFMVFMLVGCAGESRLKMDYGASYNLAKFNQTLNPDAEQDLEPVEGFDGEAGKATVDRYQKSFERPATPPSYAISIGSIARGAGIQY